MLRRKFLQSAALATTASLALARTKQQKFLWGASSSAPQTESADGRGQSIWDVFASVPGHIADGSNGSVTDRFDTLYAEDIDFLTGQGLNAFRFSIAWPRVQPDGVTVNEAGLDLYETIVDLLLSRGIEPLVTLHHWDIPSALEGAWTNRDTSYRFADFAQIVAKRLRDRVNHWAALNEPSGVSLGGYLYGSTAPGLRSIPAWAASVHYQNLAQGLAIQGLRREVPSNAQLGTVHEMFLVRPYPASTGSDQAVPILDGLLNGVILDPLFRGHYPAIFQDAIEPFIASGDLGIIAANPDFLGVNYYGPNYVVLNSAVPFGATLAGVPSGIPVTDAGRAIVPSGMTAVLARLREQYGNPPVFVTETGAAYNDPAPVNGLVSDPKRAAFLKSYIDAAINARLDGSNLQGFFVWALTDNWEWTSGFTQHYGLVQVDRTTLQRTPKQSLYSYGEIARSFQIF